MPENKQTRPESLIRPDYRTELPTPKPGTYSVVYSDPPWSIHQKGKLGASEHYSLMTDEQILALGQAVNEISADDSFCFLWVTAGALPLGIQVLEAWGFRYTNYYFWAKPRFTLGNTVRNAGELCLIGLKGKAKVAFRSQPNWGMHPLQEHSRKPEEIFMTIERLIGANEDTKMLEMFARRPAPSRLPWDIWGNELDASEPSLISLAKWNYRIPADDDSFNLASTQTPVTEAPELGDQSETKR